MKKFATLILANIWLTSCTHTPSDEVVVYVSVDDVYSRPIADLFARNTGLKVRLVTDSEETKSTGLLNRLIAEGPRPRADVFWSGDPVRAAVLKNRGLTECYRSPKAHDLPAAFSDPDGHFTGFAARFRVIIYNTNLVAGQREVPQSVSDFVNPTFAPRACIANPLFGTTSMHAAAIFQHFGENKGTEFFNRLRQAGVKMLSSNGEVRRRVSAGDFAFGITDSDDVSVAIKDGQPVSFVVPDQAGQGTVLVPSAVALIKNAPNPERGKQFIDFLLSEEVERRMAECDAAHLPLREWLPPPALFRQGVTRIRAMQLDYSDLATQLENLNAAFLRSWVESQPVRLQQ